MIEDLYPALKKLVEWLLKFNLKIKTGEKHEMYVCDLTKCDTGKVRVDKQNVKLLDFSF
jgi:hypothetical protein